MHLDFFCKYGIRFYTEIVMTSIGHDKSYSFGSIHYRVSYLCDAKLYGLLRCGKLERYKEGKNTFIDTYEFDRLMVSSYL